MKTAYRTRRSRNQTQKRPIPQCGRLYLYRSKRLKRPRRTSKVAELKERLIRAYPRLFSGVANKNPPDRGRFGTAKIKLKPNLKIYRHREYQLQGDRAEAMKKLLAEFIERGWIEPSDSEWASPAFIVPKKEKGEWRLVVDYRGLNEQTEHHSYSLPLIDSILQKQQKKRIFTVLDLKHGYHQMPLHPDSRPCTAMSTPLGPMQWKVVPMGAKNGNAVFQRMMEDLLGPVRDCADPFVDDIIIGSGTENMTEDELIDAHEKDLRRVLSELDKHNMVCKPTKASLFVKEVEFAGHVVGHGQRRPMPGKLASLHHWEKPQTISELRSFMGFCNYYSGYVRMYAELSGPLHKMLQVGKFDGRKGSKKKLAWTPEAEDAFNRLKERLLGQLGLFLVDPDKGFVLRTDASDYAVGAVLEQVRDDGTHVPVAFWSRILAEGQRRTWTAREKETYAIVCALRKWSGHIGLQPVVVCTDHQSLQSWHKEHVDTPSGPAARRARWHETFAKFDLSVVYIPGKDNTVADCLSRWAYPAGKAWMDISSHGDAEETEEAKRIIEMEKVMEQEGVKCFVVMANCTDLAKFRGARVQAIREETLEQSMVAPVELVKSVLTEDWSDDYTASEHWSKYWNAVSAPSDDEWPEGLTEDGDKLFLKDKLLVPENRWRSSLTIGTTPSSCILAEIRCSRTWSGVSSSLRGTTPSRIGTAAAVPCVGPRRALTTPQRATRCIRLYRRPLCGPWPWTYSPCLRSPWTERPTTVSSWRWTGTAGISWQSRARSPRRRTRRTSMEWGCRPRPSLMP